MSFNNNVHVGGGVYLMSFRNNVHVGGGSTCVILFVDSLFIRM